MKENLVYVRYFIGFDITLDDDYMEFRSSSSTEVSGHFMVLLIIKIDNCVIECQAVEFSF